MQSYDVLIIGGGPAGAMTGIELQKKVSARALLTRQAFPAPNCAEVC